MTEESNIAKLRYGKRTHQIPPSPYANVHWRPKEQAWGFLFNTQCKQIVSKQTWEDPKMAARGADVARYWLQKNNIITRHRKLNFPESEYPPMYFLNNAEPGFTDWCESEGDKLLEKAGSESKEAKPGKTRTDAKTRLDALETENVMTVQQISKLQQQVNQLQNQINELRNKILVGPENGGSMEHNVEPGETRGS